VLALTRIKSFAWMNNHTILLHKNGDSTILDYYSSITLANTLYKLWTTCIFILANDYIESRKINSSEQVGFTTNHSCAKAITLVVLCVHDAQPHKKNTFVC
jgi:hypothetical protein